ncbi:MAG: hypothetical protein JO196_12880 [Hyphomicrobiales bacterium]|nr:hypothetical protein [Acidobacteriaceae bacterium]MBV9053289.1 hypothetical protein [Hyphomicrobiales bacterium]
MAGILMEGDHVKDEERAAHARALAAKEREKSLKRAAEAKARVGAQKLGKALQFPGTTLSDRVVEPALQLQARQGGSLAHHRSRRPAGGRFPRL